MKLLAANSPSFKRGIDQSCPPETSVVCRYRNAVQLDDRKEHDLALKQNLQDLSIREGVRTFQLMEYKGVAVHILDESTLMATGTLKSIDGCLTASFCRKEGARRIVFESGGNTGSALTRYGRKTGLETFFFCPLDNIDLLDGRLFSDPKSHLIGVEDRRRVKEFTKLFAGNTGMRHVPEKSWRYAASMFRGLFILEQLLWVREYEWLSQTVSAAFGPVGIFQVLRAFQTELRTLPRFLGIQQEANCPMFEAWNPEGARLRSQSARKTELLTRVMYDPAPQTYKTYQDFHQLLLLTRGDLLTVNEEEFHSYICSPMGYGPILDLLRSHNIAISLRSGRVLEKTGLIALAGTLKAIDAGMIRPGGRVLCCLTSGVTEADGTAQPEWTARAGEDVLRYVESMRGIIN